MKIKKGFVLREVCGKQVIVGEGLEAINFGRLLDLNETAAWLWKEARTMDDFTVEALADRLLGEYEVPVDVARRDVEEIVNKWKEINVVE